MISKHCGVTLTPKSENKLYFKVQCKKCGVIFKQKKRQGKITNKAAIFKKMGELYNQLTEGEKQWLTGK